MQRTPLKKFCYFIAAGLAVSMLCSCSRIKLAYPFADMVIAKQAHQYLKLDKDQEKELQADIKAYMAWHRKQLLPAYAASVRKLAAELKGESSGFDYKTTAALTEKLYAETLTPMLEPTAKLLAGLKPDQVDYFEKAMLKEQERRRQEYAQGVKTSGEQGIKKGLNFWRDWFGPLDAAQEKRLLQLGLDLHPPSKVWMEEREAYHDELLRRVRAKASEAEIKEALKRSWLREGGTKMQAKELEAYFKNVLFEVLRPEQRLKAARKLEGYAADFEDLAGIKAGD